MEENKKKKIPLAVKIIIPVAIVGIICALLFAVVLALINYNTAMALFKAGQYEEAGDQFRSLGSYKDSVMMLARSLYREGEQDYEDGDFEDAVDPFEEMASYYPDMEVLVTDANYMDGVSKGVDGDFKGAMKALGKMDNYGKAKELIAAAEAGETAPLIEEEQSHELPISEDDVIDIVEGHQEGGPVAETSDSSDGSSLLSVEWLVDISCRAEGVDTIEALEEKAGLTIKCISLYMEQFNHFEDEWAWSYRSLKEIHLFSGAHAYVIPLTDTLYEEAENNVQHIIPDDYFSQLPGEYIIQRITYYINSTGNDNNFWAVDETMPVFSVSMGEFVNISDTGGIDVSAMADPDSLEPIPNSSAQLGTYSGGVVLIQTGTSMLNVAEQERAVYATVDYQPVSIEVHEAQTAQSVSSQNIEDSSTPSQEAASNGTRHQTILVCNDDVIAVKEDGTVYAPEEMQYLFESWTDIVSVHQGLAMGGYAVMGIRGDGTESRRPCGIGWRGGPISLKVISAQTVLSDSKLMEPWS